MFLSSPCHPSLAGGSLSVAMPIDIRIQLRCQKQTPGGAPSIAKLVYNCHFTMVCGWLYLYYMGYKPSNITVAVPPCITGIRGNPKWANNEDIVTIKVWISTSEKSHRFNTLIYFNNYSGNTPIVPWFIIPWNHIPDHPCMEYLPTFGSFMGYM